MESFEPPKPTEPFGPLRTIRTTCTTGPCNLKVQCPEKDWSIEMIKMVELVEMIKTKKSLSQKRKTHNLRRVFPYLSGNMPAGVSTINIV
jgi:hypothetical protein